MPYVSRAGHRTYYEVSGALSGAPTLVMIRGLSRSSAYWLDVRGLVERHFRLVVLDNRGVGRSDAPGPGFSVSDMADDVAAVLDHAGISSARVFGLSLGGMIAMRFAIRHPSRTERLVLGATTAGGRRRIPIPAPTVVKFLGTAGMSIEETMRTVAPITLSRRALERRPEIIDRWIELAHAEPRNPLSLLGQLWAAGQHDATRELGQIRCPTLIVTGDEDTLIPPENSQQLWRGIPSSTLKILPGAGHDFPTEEPEETARLLVDFCV